MKRHLLVAVLLLTACASPQTVSTPAPIDIPVAVPCKILGITKPVFAVETLRNDASMFEQVRALLATEQQRTAYEAQLEAAIKTCQ